ncbi:hypothetical protein KKF91_06105 [Myxococcota bacterium]|nr:hypothetical protein [Myxococcota bacterium]
MRRLYRRAPRALALLSLLVLTGGCDDDGAARPSLSISFVTPHAGQTLSCVDDLDPATPDSVEFNVEGLVVLKAAEPDGLSARLVVGTALTRVVDVPASGRVIFEGVPFAEGAVALRLELLDGGADAGASAAVLADAGLDLSVNIDTSDPACQRERPPPSLRFTQPTEGAVFTEDDDGDETLSNGLQINARLALENIQGAVEITVDGGAPKQIQAVGVILDVDLDLEIGDGARTSHTIMARFGEASAQIEVFSEVSGCALTLTPRPTGEACDLTAADDLDPETDGLQVSFVAQTNCTDVVFLQGGVEAQTVGVTNGQATAILTLDEGEVSVSARAETAGGLTGEVAPYTLTVSSADPALSVDLTDFARNDLDLSDALAEDESAVWRLRGQARGLTAGEDVRVGLSPALPGAPATIQIGADGALSLDLSATYWCGSLTLSADHPCGGAAVESPTYEICLDGVRPGLSLTAPEDGAQINAALDVDAAREGHQIEARLAVEDPRPEADYEISVECRREGEQAFEIKSDAPMTRGALAEVEGIILLSFAPADVGAWICRPVAEDSPNPALAAEVTWTISFAVPTFTLESPPEGEAACFTADELLISGVGAALDENGAALAVILTPEGGEALAPYPLESQGEQRYAVRPQDLEDGRYEARVYGEIQGGVAVAVSPAAPVAFILDTAAPALRLASPSAETSIEVEGDANGDLSDCVQTALRFEIDDPNATQLCFTLNGGDEACLDISEGIAESDLVDLIRGENPLNAYAVDCAGNRGQIEVTLTASEACPPPIRVIDPPNGGRVSMEAHDAAPETADVLDLDVTLSAGLPEGSEVEVILDGDAVFGPATLDAEGQAVIRVTLPIPDGQDDLLRFTLQGRAGENTGPIAQVILVLAQPTLALTPPDGCVNGATLDASGDPGFQLAVDATSSDVLSGQTATLFADCGAGVVEASALVNETANGAGAARFIVTLPEEGECTLSAQTPDGAGRIAEAAPLQVRVDRVAPTITFNRPTDGALLTEISDEDAEREGLQLTPSLRICGAPMQTLSVTSEIYDAPQEIALGAMPTDCEQVQLTQTTLPLGALEMQAEVSDACGNDTRVTINAEVDSGANAIIVDPADGQTILVVDDDDPATPGCQIDLQAISTGLDGSAEVEICTDVEGGPTSALCGQRALANAAPCVLNADASNISCPVSLSDGVHNLIVAARFGERITSQEISVRADCTAPRVGLLRINEAGDDCINRAERTNPSAGNHATVTVHVEVEGVEAGRSLPLRLAPDGAFQGAILIDEQGQGELSVTLQPGTHTLYVTGQDAAGNPLPNPPRVSLTVRVDTLVSAPTLQGLIAGACLNAGEDEGGADGLQYTLQIQTGAEADEVVTSVILIDGASIHEQTGADAQAQVQATLAEGERSLSATVTDTCGNVGQLSPTAFRVDTIAPTLSLDAPTPGQVFTEADDANADPSDGFQIDATLSPGDVENGREVRVSSGASRLSSTPAQILTDGGAINARLTLPPGAHSLTARVTDACGNPAVTDPVNVTVEIDGCTSRFTSFNADPQIYGPGGGVVDGDGLRISPSAEVDLFDPACAEATATLLLDGAPLGAGVLVGAGLVQFNDARIPHGEHTLSLRVDLNGALTLSGNQTVIVDLEAPVVTITEPTTNVTLDSDPQTEGQQTTVRASVVEAATDSPRAAQLYIDGAASGAPVVVGAAASTTVSFTGVTLPSGAHTLRVCVTDQAENEGCDDQAINADPSAPGGMTLDVVITDARRTAIELRFTAPGDDGAGGPSVTAYELRRSDAPITADNWAQATLLTRYTQDLAAPGAAEALLYEGLALNTLHHLALRAYDEVNRAGPVAAGEADLTFNEVVFEFTGPAGWDISNLGNNQSAVQRLGSVDGDAFDDILVAATAAGVSVAGIIYGAANADDAVATPIALPAGLAFLSMGGGIGDVNGDGIPDFALGGLTADFSGSQVSIYLGCAAPADCSRDDIITPDATLTLGGFRYLNNVIGLGDFDGGGFGDLLVGGSLAGGGSQAYVVSGRATGDWAGATLDLLTDATALNVPGRAFAGTAAVAVPRADGVDVILSTGQGAAGAAWRFSGPGAAPVQIVNPCPGVDPYFGSYMGGGVDLNGDGAADLLIGDRNSKRIAFFDGAGAGDSACFALNPALDLFGFVFDTAGDINGDGAVDVLVTHQEPQSTTDAFILYNDGAGGFGQGATINRLPDVRVTLPAAWKLGVAGIGAFNAGSEDDFAVATPAPDAIQITVFY